MTRAELTSNSGASHGELEFENTPNAMPGFGLLTKITMSENTGKRKNSLVYCSMANFVARSAASTPKDNHNHRAPGLPLIKTRPPRPKPRAGPRFHQALSRSV